MAQPNRRIDLPRSGGFYPLGRKARSLQARRFRASHSGETAGSIRRGGVPHGVTVPAERTLAALLLDGVETWSQFLDAFQARLAQLAAEFGGVRNRPRGWGDDFKITFYHGTNPRIAVSHIPSLGEGWRAWFEPSQAPLLAPLPDDLPGVQRTTAFTAKALLAMVAMAGDALQTSTETAKAATEAPPSATAFGLKPEPTDGSDAVEQPHPKTDFVTVQGLILHPEQEALPTMHATDAPNAPPWLSELKGDLENAQQAISATWSNVRVICGILGYI